MRSYTLLKDEGIRVALKKLLTSTRYRTVLNTIYGMRFAIDTPLNETEARTHFRHCPDIMAGFMLDDESLISRTVACSRAYGYRFRARVPDEICKQWTETAAPVS